MLCFTFMVASLTGQILPNSHTCCQGIITKIGGGPLPLSPKSAEFPERLSPTSNLFSFNHLSRFHSSPPHVSPLESYGCRKQGWVGGMDGFVGATFRWPGSPSRCQTIGRPLPREATRITFGGTQNRRVFFLSWN